MGMGQHFKRKTGSSKMEMFQKIAIFSVGKKACFPSSFGEIFHLTTSFWSRRASVCPAKSFFINSTGTCSKMGCILWQRHRGVTRTDASWVFFFLTLLQVAEWHLHSCLQAGQDGSWSLEWDVIPAWFAIPGFFYYTWMACYSKRQLI
jgi:hypothetical protein